jgi:Spy/CpxP family protein refolding chaperone
MENNSKRQWQIRGAVLAIFLLGFAAGILAITAYQAGRGRSNSDGPRRDRYEQMLNQLNLSAEQKPQVEQILKDSRAEVFKMRKESEPRFAELRRQTNERLQAVLTPEQWERWQQMGREMRRRRRGPRSQP